MYQDFDSSKMGLTPSFSEVQSEEIHRFKIIESSFSRIKSSSLLSNWVKASYTCAITCSIQSLLLLLEQTSCSIKSRNVTFSENGNAAIIHVSRFDAFYIHKQMRPTGSDSNAVLGSKFAKFR